MKLLKKYGLTNPRIEFIRYPFNGQLDIVLEADNKHRIKEYLYINKIFRNFLIQEIKNGMYDDMKSVILASNSKITLDTNVKIEIINYLESSFERYLENNKSYVEQSLNELYFEAPKITFSKINNPLFIKFSEDDIKNGYCFYFSFSQTTAKKLGIDKYIIYEPKILDCIKNICYVNEKFIKCDELNAYYHILSDDRLKELREAKSNLTWHKALESGFMQVTLIATNPSTQIKKPKKEISFHWVLKDTKDFNQNLIK